jgi:sugar lactone lactonase YvrE
MPQWPKLSLAWAPLDFMETLALPTTTWSRPALASLALLALAGCMGTGTPGSGIPSPAAPGASSLSSALGLVEPAHSAAANELFVTSNTGNSVGIYPQKGNNQQPTDYLNGSFAQPQGIYVSPKGVVYVGDTDNDRIFVYKKESLNSFETLSDNGQPRELAADSKGTLYAGNVNQGNVAVYVGGATSPTSYISIPNAAAVLGIAVDAKDNLFVSFDTQRGGDGSGQIDEFLAGTTNPISLGITLVSAEGMAFDKQGNLIVCDSADSDPSAAAVYIFAPGATKPSHTMSFPNAYPISVALNKSGKDLFVALTNGGSVQVFDYAKFKLIDTISNGSASYPNSIAVYQPFSP